MAVSDDVEDRRVESVRSFWSLIIPEQARDVS